MKELYIKKEDTIEFIDNGRLVNTSIGTILIDLKKLRDNLRVLRVNNLIDTYLGCLCTDAEIIKDLEAEKYFREIRETTSAIDTSMDSLINNISSISDELDKASEKLMVIIKKAKKVRDSGFFESEFLKEYSDRDKIRELIDNTLQQYEQSDKAED